MSLSNLSVFAERSDYGRTVSLWLSDGTHQVNPVEMSLEPVEQFTITLPSLLLDVGVAQSLLDALIDAGLEPKSSPPGDVLSAAYKDHIQFAEYVALSLLPPPEEEVVENKIMLDPVKLPRGL